MVDTPKENNGDKKDAVGDITTEYKPPRRGRFTLNYIEAHEDLEDGTLL